MWRRFWVSFSRSMFLTNSGFKIVLLIRGQVLCRQMIGYSNMLRVIIYVHRHRYINVSIFISRTLHRSDIVLGPVAPRPSPVTQIL